MSVSTEVLTDELTDLRAMRRSAASQRRPARHQVMQVAKSRPIVRPSIINGQSGQSASSEPFTAEQQLKPFARWTGQSTWVPPRDCGEQLAATMLAKNKPFAKRNARWQSVVNIHRDQFTHVRQIELYKPSIRLPQGRLFVSITERQNFDAIAEDVPASVQTRLDEFMAGRGKRRGVKVYYLKPICVEVDDQLIFTSGRAIESAIAKIQTEVFAEYDRRWLGYYSRRMVAGTVAGATAVPRAMLNYMIERRRRALQIYQAKLEYERRKRALRAAEEFGRNRTTGCTFDEMLALTNPLDPIDVAQQYGIEHEISEAKRKQLVALAAGSLPWFTALSLGLGYLATVMGAVSTAAAPGVVMCDPAFVAEFPERPGVLMNIGHFDDVAGVRHIEM